MKLRKHKEKTNKARSKRSEKDAAKFFGGKVQIASGAINVLGLKGDLRHKKIHLDDKVTNAKSFAVNYETWKKLWKEAFKLKKMPIMRISFTQGANLYVIDEMAMVKFLDFLETYDA